MPNCVICGKAFFYKHNRLKRYCSEECHYKLHVEEMKNYRESHKEYFNNYKKEWSKKHPNYCKEYNDTHKETIKQYHESHRKEILQKNRDYNKAKRKPKICKVCGNIFFGYGKLCSDYCRYLNHEQYVLTRRGSYKPTPPSTCNCVNCKKEFLSKNRNKKTCSVACSKKLQLQTSRVSMNRRRHKHYNDILYHYSNGEMKCACCGESHLEFLTLDHIIPVHRKINKRINNYSLYVKLKHENFPPGYQVLCFECNWLKNTYPQIFCYAHHPELYTTVPQRSKYNYWKQILNHYGAKCTCCGKTNEAVLSLDHIKGNGKEDKISYKQIIDKGFPVDYQILCMNCNCKKSAEDKPFCKVHHPELYRLGETS